LMGVWRAMMSLWKEKKFKKLRTCKQCRA
jgi:hypothetical protein